jgi:hypothetical protein
MYVLSSIYVLGPFRGSRQASVTILTLVPGDLYIQYQSRKPLDLAGAIAQG